MQQHLFEASSEREWSRKLFDEKVVVLGRIASAAYRLEKSASPQEATANLKQLQELEEETVLWVPFSLKFDIVAACDAARRYIETGQRDDRPTERGRDSPDLGPSCTRIITACRKRVLHANGIDMSEAERAEDAVSTAYGAIGGTSPRVKIDRNEAAVR